MSHLVGHEGQGSLLSLLKLKGLANGVCCSASDGIPGGYGSFKVGVALLRITYLICDSLLSYRDDVTTRHLLLIVIFHLSLLSHLTCTAPHLTCTAPPSYLYRPSKNIKVSIDLSEAGLLVTDEIVLLVFQYLAMVRQSGILERIFDECKQLNAASFRYKESEVSSSYCRLYIYAAMTSLTPLL